MKTKVLKIIGKGNNTQAKKLQGKKKKITKTDIFNTAKKKTHEYMEEQEGKKIRFFSFEEIMNKFTSEVIALQINEEAPLITFYEAEEKFKKNIANHLFFHFKKGHKISITEFFKKEEFSDEEKEIITNSCTDELFKNLSEKGIKFKAIHHIEKINKKNIRKIPEKDQNAYLEFIERCKQDAMTYEDA